jgi:hypothetical protein
MRIGVLALVGLLALPVAAAAQTPGGTAPEGSSNLVPYSAFGITPWVGLRLGYGSGPYYIRTGDGSVYRLNETRGGGAALGLNLEARVRGPLNLVGGFGYTAADQDVLSIEDENGSGGSIVVDGPRVFFAKAGLQYRLPDPVPDNRRFHPAAFVTVAPAVVITDFPAYGGFDDDVNGSATHFALNLGVDALTRIGSRGLALSIGFEDYITFWNQGRMRRRDEAFLGDVFETPVVVDYDSRLSNVLILRLGGSWRF